MCQLRICTKVFKITILIRKKIRKTKGKKVKKQSLKYPSFIFIKILTISLFISEQESIAKDNFSTKLEKDTEKIKFRSIEDYREYRKFCEKEKIEHHTYRDPTPRPKKNLFQLL